MIHARFCEADRPGADALVSAIEAVLALSTRYETLAQRVRSSDQFSVGQTDSGRLVQLERDAPRAAHVARCAKSSQQSLTRRERQLAEVLLVLIDGDRARAAGLASEHIAEFDEDKDGLGLVATCAWVRLGE